MSSGFFHTHVHSEFSSLDAISKVEALVEKAYRMHQPAIALTDHGNGSGWVQLYRAGQKFGLPVFPGFEGYLTADPIPTDPKDKNGSKLERFHIGLLSLDFEGYKQLAQLMSLSHTRPRFSRFPRFDLNDLAMLAGSEHIAVMTGCFFGLVQQNLVRNGYDAAKRIVEMYARWFPNTFVELQNHNIDHSGQATAGNPWVGDFDHDSDICEALFEISMDVGLPVLVTQDAHYLNSNQRVAHNLMKQMVYRGEQGSNEFPGDSFHLATSEWVEEHHDPEHWQVALAGHKELLSLHDLELPALDKYKPHIPSTKRNPLAWLRREVKRKLREFERRGLLVKPRRYYEKRIAHEDDIIAHLERKGMGAAGYMSLWVEFVNWCKSGGRTGVPIMIEARGSANSFLHCYLLGITSIDPIQRELLPERFLSKDRKKPPDVDMDIEDVRRDEAVEWIEGKFGVTRIGTYSALGSRDDDDKGSILVSYNSYLRSVLGNEKFIPKFGRGIERISEVRFYNEDDYVGLRQLSKLQVKRSYGVHPAGLLLPGDDQAIEEYVPTMLVASSNTIVSQFIGDDVEELGYTKMDLLGQRTLTVLRRAQELIGRKDPTDLSWIPDDDKETCRFLSQGIPNNGVFQFEGYSMAMGAREMKIRNTNDCILAGALYRPACMESGMKDLYLTRRFDMRARKEAEGTHPHPAFADVLKPTYGVVLFQEQVLEIMRRLGLDYEGINTFFKIVKDSGKGATERNVERLKEVEKVWSQICEDNDIDDLEGAWHYIEGYTQYGFNKGHSAGYGVRSYRAAYLKVHYPLEFMAALLESWAGRPKEPTYIQEARRMEIRLLPPDVNVSGAFWTLDRKKEAIRKGLSSIKGIGENAAREIADNQPYIDFDNFLALNSARTVSGKPAYLKEGEWSGNLEKLRNAGALGSLGIRRNE